MAVTSYRSGFNFRKYSLIFAMILAGAGLLMFLRGNGLSQFLLVFPALLMLYLGGYYLVQQKTKRINDLFANGDLIKDLPYEREEYVNLLDIQAVIALIRKSDERLLYSLRVNLPLDNGQVIIIRTDRGYPADFLNTHPVVDVLIDPEDFNNYHLDFDIQPASMEAEVASTSEQEPASEPTDQLTQS